MYSKRSICFLLVYFSLLVNNIHGWTNDFMCSFIFPRLPILSPIISFLFPFSCFSSFLGPATKGSWPGAPPDLGAARPPNGL